LQLVVVEVAVAVPVEPHMPGTLLAVAAVAQVATLMRLIYL
jgi:hypothetical protein